MVSRLVMLPKNERTDLFGFFCFFTLHGKKPNLFVHLGVSMAQICLWFYLTFSRQQKHKQKKWDWQTWVFEKHKLCVNSIWVPIFQHCAFVRYPSRFRSYALNANLAFSWRISAWLRRSTEIWGFWRLFLEIFISMNSSRLIPPSPSLSFCAMVRSIHSRSEIFKEYCKFVCF